MDVYILHGLKGRSKRSIWWRCLRIQKRCSGLGQTRKLHPERKAWFFGYRCSLQVWKMQCSGREYLALGTEKLRCPRSADWHLQFDLAHILLWPEEICNMDLPKHKQPSCIKLTWCNLTGQCLCSTLCRAGLACAIWLRVVADSDWSRTGDFAAYDIIFQLWFVYNLLLRNCLPGTALIR